MQQEGKLYLKMILLAVLASILLASAAVALSTINRNRQLRSPPVSPPVSPRIATTTPVRRTMINTGLAAIKPHVTYGAALVLATSTGAFAYAHGTAVAGNKVFLGMSAIGGNPFATNQVVVFDRRDIAHPTFIVLKDQGEIDTATYDTATDRIYFVLSGNGALKIYSFDPHTYAVKPVISTTTIDAGRRPAIVSDGTYIYGITNTPQSSVFRVNIKTGGLYSTGSGHIPNGHSAAIGIYASSTELYFGGDMTNGFEKADAGTLEPLAVETISPCTMTNDMPFFQTSGHSGYVYIGCETVPYGLRVNTADMSYDRYSLPGASFGQFIFGSDLYNASQDGNIDVFQDRDLTNLTRYRLTKDAMPLKENGLDPALNELMYIAATDELYATDWYGSESLYKIATTTK